MDITSILCKKKILHFDAAGHLPYAKAARLYLQQIVALKHTKPVDDYTQFTERGYFTIRRLDAFWSGIFQTKVEQFLMRMPKTTGGMTRGRGITNSILTTWVHTAPRCITKCNSL